MQEQDNSKAGIRQRKVDHVELCAREDVEYRLTKTLLLDVRLMHNSLPELAMDELRLDGVVAGAKLSVPVAVSGMTGGAESTLDINRTLAKVAARHGAAFGVGSQRAMLIDPSLAATYRVRDVAPDVVLFGNIGAVQVTESKPSDVIEMAKQIEADALCVHLNPGQELIQEEGDRDFRGCIDALQRLLEASPLPIIVKETGCGMSPATAKSLARIGIEWVDVSGAGGTTWVGVEALRARPGRRQIGEDFWEWGVPTAASIHYAAQAGLNVIASGGLRNGHDIARAIALGASVGGMALPFLRAVMDDGEEGAEAVMKRAIEGIRTAMLLTGSRDLEALRNAPRIVTGELRTWMHG